MLFGIAFFPCEKAEIDKDNADIIPTAIKVALRFFINLFCTCCHMESLKEIFLKGKGFASSFEKILAEAIKNLKLSKFSGYSCRKSFRKIYLNFTVSKFGLYGPRRLTRKSEFNILCL